MIDAARRLSRLSLKRQNARELEVIRRVKVRWSLPAILLAWLAMTHLPPPPPAIIGLNWQCLKEIRTSIGLVNVHNLTVSIPPNRCACSLTTVSNPLQTTRPPPTLRDAALPFEI